MRTNAQRILIAEDHSFLAEAFKQVLETEYYVVATVSDGRAMVRTALEMRPDLVIVDIAMPQLNGLDAGEQLKKELPKVKLLYVSMHFDADIAAETFRRGGSGYLPKTCGLSELKTAVHKVLNGESLPVATHRSKLSAWPCPESSSVNEWVSTAQREAERGVAAVSRRKADEGSGERTEHRASNGGFSQVSNYGTAQGE